MCGIHYNLCVENDSKVLKYFLTSVNTSMVQNKTEKEKYAFLSL